MKKILLFILKVLIAGGIIAYLIHKNGVAIKDIAKIPVPVMILAFLSMLIQNLLTGIRWHSLLKCAGIHLTLREAISLTLQGCFYTLFLPGGAVGGDVIKAGILAKRAPAGKKFTGVFSILIDRLCGLTALMIVCLGSVLWCLPEIHTFPEKTRYFIYTLVLACAGAICAAFCLFFHDILYKIPFIKKFSDFLDKYTKGSFHQAADAMCLYRSHWKRLLAWTTATVFIFFPFLGQCLWLAAYGVTGTMPSWKMLFCAANLSNAVSAIPLTQGGIGTRDFVTTSFLTGCGFPENAAGVIPLVYTGVFLLVSFSGGIFVFYDSFFRKKVEKTCNPPKTEL